MKIEREKRIRREFVSNEIIKTVGKMIKMVTGTGQGGKTKSYRNICKETGRSRGVINGKVRMEWRKQADRGVIEGVRRASW